MRRRVLASLAASAAAAVLLAAFARRAIDPPSTVMAPALDAPVLAALPVRVARVVRGPLVQTIDAAGLAVAAREVTVHAQLTGVVQRIDVGVSDAVGEGASLLAFDSTDVALGARQARAARARAFTAYRDITALDDPADGAALRAARDSVARARSGLAGAELDVERAELELRRARVLAPFAARVAAVHVVPGQWVRAGDRLVSLVSSRDVRVHVPVLESEVAQLAPGGGAVAIFAALPRERFAARVITVSPVVDRDSRASMVALRLVAGDGRVRPGMYARVRIDARRLADRVVVPRAAILERDGRRMLFVLRAVGVPSGGESVLGIAAWRYVTTGVEGDSLVEIVAGAPGASVEPGEWVLVEGHATLVHEARVRASVVTR